MQGQNYSLPLGLDLAPAAKREIDPDLLQDLYRLYNACKLLAEGLDAYTGIVGAPFDDWDTVGSGAIMVQNLSRLYVQYNATATLGQLIALNSSGQAILGTVGNVIGWAPAGVTAGNYGEVRLFGLHTAVTGLTPGTSYYASSTPGGLTFTVTSQKVGVALATNRLLFFPDMRA